MTESVLDGTGKPPKSRGIGKRASLAASGLRGSGESRRSYGDDVRTLGYDPREAVRRDPCGIADNYLGGTRGR